MYGKLPCIPSVKSVVLHKKVVGEVGGECCSSKGWQNWPPNETKWIFL